MRVQLPEIHRALLEKPVTAALATVKREWITPRFYRKVHLTRKPHLERWR